MDFSELANDANQDQFDTLIVQLAKQSTMFYHHTMNIPDDKLRRKLTLQFNDMYLGMIMRPKT